MKKLLIFSLAAFALIPAFGQKQWTLRECIDYAIENNIEIKQQKVNVEQADINLNTSKNSRLPNLDASIGQSFDFGRSRMSSGVYENLNSLGAGFSVASSIPIFSGMQINNTIKSNELNFKAATEGLKKARENLEISVTSRYLDVLMNKEILKVYVDQHGLNLKQERLTQAMVDAGKVPYSQLLDIRAQLAKDELNMVTSDNELRLSLLNLSQLLNIAGSENFDISEPSLNFVPDDTFMRLSANEIYETALGIKPHVKEAVYKLKSAKSNLKVAKGLYWPTLSFDMSYHNNLMHVFKSSYDNQSVSKQLKNNGREVLGLSLRIPVFNRLQTRNQVRFAQLTMHNSELELENVKLGIYKEISLAHQGAVSAKSKFVATQKATLAAQEAYNYMEERYAVGKATAYELNDAQTKLLSARSEQLQAKYDYIFKNKILDFYCGREIDID